MRTCLLDVLIATLPLLCLGGSMDIISRISKELSNQKHKDKSPEQIESFLRKHLKPISEIKTKAKVPEIYTDAFNKFWSAYPRKDAKRAAFKSFWVKGEPIDQCIEALKWQTKGWNGEFTPMAATYLNQRRYEDEREICPAEDIMSEADMMRLL